MKTASSRAGFPIACPNPDTTEHYLEDAGFVDVSRRKIRVPFQLNPEDEYEWNVTAWYRGAMTSDDQLDQNAFLSKYFKGTLLCEDIVVRGREAQMWASILHWESASIF